MERRDGDKLSFLLEEQQASLEKGMNIGKGALEDGVWVCNGSCGSVQVTSASRAQSMVQEVGSINHNTLIKQITVKGQDAVKGNLGFSPSYL